jgi:hypothetical protein
MLSVWSTGLVVDAIEGAEIGELAATKFSAIVSPDHLDGKTCLVVDKVQEFFEHLKERLGG